MPPFAPVFAALLTASLAQAAMPAPRSSAAGVSTPAAAAPTLPPASDVADARALRWMRAMQAGRVDRSELAPAMAAALPPGILRLVAAEYGPLGAPTGFALLRHERVAGGEAAIYRATFASEDATFAFAIDHAGRIIGLHFFPPDPAPGAPQFGPTASP